MPLGVHLEQAGAAQGPVDVDGPVAGVMPYSLSSDDGHPRRLGVVEQRGEGGVEVGGRLHRPAGDSGPKRCRS